MRKKIIKNKDKLFIGLLLFSLFSLKNYSQTEIWGLSNMGGVNNVGAIFKTDGSGNNQTTEYEFTKIEGENPTYNQLTEATDGKLYGMTSGGGENFTGILFQYDQITNTLIKKIDFNTVNGAVPKGSLIQATDGKLYGMTQQGGTNIYDGTLFQYDPASNILIKKLDFDYANTGGNPSGSLIQATNGIIYGMTEAGGIYGYGVLFQYDITTDVYTKLMDFEGLGDGGKPLGSLVQATNGKLYGMTSLGGLNGDGVIFEYDIISNVYTNKFNFDGLTNGSYPTGSLIQSSDGKLYGMTQQGGANNLGVLFQYNPISGSFVKKFSFSATIGSEPAGSLMQATDGKLYGMTQHGGVNNKGVLFQYIPVLNSYNKKVDFSGLVSGSNPQGSVTQATNGKIYGMSYDGGTDDLGVLFEYDFATSTFNKKVNFGQAINGRYPLGALVKATDGKLYGTTIQGGNNDCGVLFQYDPYTHIYSKKIDFDSIIHGHLPRAALIQATDGMLYGITQKGGINNLGVMFQYNPTTNTFVKKIDFDGSLKGSEPWGALFQANDGMLYGVTASGGLNNFGVLFQYDIVTSTYNKKIDFNGINNGKAPIGALIQAIDTKLYGVTNEGGLNNMGVIFQYDISSNNLLKKIDFDGATKGRNPTGSLIEATDGNLYGITGWGGINDFGVLFQYNAGTNNYTKKIDFNGLNNGQIPGKLIQASNGNLYGTTAIGGLYNKGVLFEYNFITDIYSKKNDFNGNNGGYLFNNCLVEISPSVSGVKEQGSSNSLLIYPNPSFDNLNIIDNEMIKQLELISITGQILLSKMVNEKSYQLQVGDLNQGVYFVKITFYNNKSVVRKIFKN